MKKNSRFFLFFLPAFLMIQMVAAQDYQPFEQAPDPEPIIMQDTDPGGPGCDPDDFDCIPIDGGLIALLAAGVGYGVKRARDSRKKNVEEVEG